MRPLTPEYIELLAEKKLCGTITPEEQALLEQWLHQEPGEQMIWSSDDRDEMAFRKRLLKRIKEDAGISYYPYRVGKVSILQGYRWAAAAVILLLFAGGVSYFLLMKKDSVPVGITNKKVMINNIASGHSGAILTLSNGHKIVLDSAGNGRIAIQGNRQLVKKNGQLVYEKTTRETVSKNRTAAGDDITYNIMTTPRGREFKLILSDGTKVWLNAASSITYPAAFAGKERQVTITGEAYFEVTHDARKPFVVYISSPKTGGREGAIKVLGTHFDVMAYPNEQLVKTTLLEGSVRVTKEAHQVIIAPGQQASFSTQSDHIHVARVDAEQTVAWVKGKLSLDNLGVEAIMRKISRWYNVDVKFEGPVPQGQYWGLINRNVSLPDMLRVMRANGINARFRDNKVIVSGN